MDEIVCSVNFSNKISVGISGENESAARIVFCLSDIMGLHKGCDSLSRKIIVRVENQRLGAIADISGNDPLICTLNPPENNDMMVAQCAFLAALIARKAGGVMLHGALVEKNSEGIIIAGPGGIGKTTACRRLPNSWRVLSDDCTLVVCSGQGNFRASPLPTWSNFMFRKEPAQGFGTCNISENIPIKALFFLCRGSTPKLKPLRSVEAVGMMLTSAHEALGQLPYSIADRVHYFDFLCTLAKTIPVFILSREGEFWNSLV